MSEPLIKISPLNLAVYGQIQYGYDFPVNGVMTYGNIFSDAVQIAAEQRAISLERQYQPLSLAVKQQNQALADIGNALSEAAYIQDKAKGIKLGDTSKTVDCPAQLAVIRAVCQKYSLPASVTKYLPAGGSITRPDAMKLFEGLRLALNSEQNKAYGAMQELNAVFSKHGNAWSAVGKLLKKIDKTRLNTIHKIQ